MQDKNEPGLLTAAMIIWGICEEKNQFRIISMISQQAPATQVFFQVLFLHFIFLAVK
jgi:hypothetical protein